MKTVSQKPPPLLDIRYHEVLYVDALVVRNLVAMLMIVNSGFQPFKKSVSSTRFFDRRPLVTRQRMHRYERLLAEYFDKKVTTDPSERSGLFPSQGAIPPLR